MISTLCFINPIFSQKITLFNNAIPPFTELLSSEGDVCNFQSRQCAFTIGAPVFYYLPDGSFIKQDAKRETINNEVVESHYFYEKDIQNCQERLLRRLNIEDYRDYLPGSQFGVSDYLGRIYFNLREKNNSGNYFICRINNLYDTKIQFLFAYTINGPNAENYNDITFVKDKVYLLETNHDRLIICDTSFNRLGYIENIPYLIRSLMAVSYECDSTLIYAFHCSTSRFEVDNVTGYCSDTMFVSKYDINTNTFTPVCYKKMTSKTWGAWSSSSLEFLASDPECDLLIDLDRDNSSGLYPYDYQLSKNLCLESNVAISDTDLYIHTSAPLDSIKLTLHGIKDGMAERLISKVLPGGFNLYRLNDSTYSLKSPIPANDSLFRLALSNILYEHTGIERTSGTRRIEVQGFNIHKSGVKISSFINVGSSRPYSGRDTSIAVCGTKKIEGLSALIGGQPGGQWSPALTNNDNYDSFVDLALNYGYFTGDSICGYDTAIVRFVTANSMTPVFINLDTILCANTIFTLAGKIYRDTGQYSQSIVNVQGCDSIIYTISLKPSPIPPIVGIKNMELCIAGDTIILSVDTLYRQIVWGGNIFTPRNLHTARTVLAGGYMVSGIDRFGCASSDTFVIRPPAFRITTNDMLDLDFVNNRPLDVGYSALGGPSAYIWTPRVGLNCYDCAVPKLTDDVDRVYKIEAHSEVGCRYFDSLTVTYKKPTKYFFPNVLKIHSTDAGQNSRFYVQGLESYPYDLEIFDRWGHVVFSIRDLMMNDPSGGWQPAVTGSAPGVYVYKVNIHTPAGDQIMVGDITVVK